MVRDAIEAHLAADAERTEGSCYDLSSDLAGILTGVLLLITIAIDRLSIRRGFFSASELPKDEKRVWSSAFRRSEPDRLKGELHTFSEEEITVKNSQVAILCAVILTAALIVAASNWMLVR